jgi:hypothetical protein
MLLTSIFSSNINNSVFQEVYLTTYITQIIHQIVEATDTGVSEIRVLILTREKTR